MRKLHLFAQLVAIVVLLATTLLYVRASQPETVNGCRPSGLLLLQVPPEPTLDDSLIWGQVVGKITAPGAILYAVPLQGVHGQVLWQRAAYTARPMASMTKVMSLLLLLEYLRGRDLNEQHRVPYGGAAAQQPFDAAVAGLEYGQELSWAQLLSYAIITSAKDAIHALVLLLGKEQGGAQRDEIEALDDFVQRMNERAAELGLGSARFVDPDGWSEENRISPLDMARLAAFYSASFPAALAWHRQPQVRIGARQKANTNLLLSYYSEVEGLKTGFTYEAGFNFSAVAQRGGWRYIAVVMGIEDSDVQRGLLRRAAEAEMLLNWGLENFAPLDMAPLQVMSAMRAGAKLPNFVANLVNQESLRAALAAIAPSLGPYLLPIDLEGVGQGLLQAGQSLELWGLRLKESLSWHLYWNGRDWNYGEIWLEDRPLARFALLEQPRYILGKLPFVWGRTQLELLAKFQ